ncbi:hypothetical protein BU14_0151s0012 [Porphyra umbilicalis]|uniref:Protein kinase domain-containing protein n=1 Tax=Porphyra umbilicalis TaxID=2786 RepID=A0A1X6P9C8_PORUM|nr:hypothetical protein BU14_0151s0012 [Porphyra umbilicalis]|eukprot:OSX77370.1 hypothetical protein BU14_0151s0012 [Porphyra umbilicalis]
MDIPAHGAPLLCGCTGEPHAMVDLPVARVLIDKTSHIGDGGFSDVYKGEYRKVEDGAVVQVALKRAFPQCGVSGEPLSECLVRKEAHLYTSLQHPCLVRCWGSLTLDGRRTLVLDLMRGGTLDKVVARSRAEGRSLPHAFVLFVLRDVAAALSYLHGGYGEVGERGARDGTDQLRYYAHGDVQQSNVLLERPMEDFSTFSVSPDQGPIARLGDLGTMRTFIVDQGHHTVPAQEGIYGPFPDVTWPGDAVTSCPSYTAPEALANYEWTPESDVWSWGILAFELIAGKRAWDYTNDTKFTSLRLKIMHNKVRLAWPDTIPSHFAAVQGLAETTLLRDPAERPLSRQLLDDVNKLVAQL